MNGPIGLGRAGDGVKLTANVNNIYLTQAYLH